MHKLTKTSIKFHDGCEHLHRRFTPRSTFYCTHHTYSNSFDTRSLSCLCVVVCFHFFVASACIVFVINFSHMKLWKLYNSVFYVLLMFIEKASVCSKQQHLNNLQHHRQPLVDTIYSSFYVQCVSEYVTRIFLLLYVVNGDTNVQSILKSVI